MHTYVIALDQGTTSSRAVLFDESARIVAMKSYEFEQIYPQPGWVEHDPAAILNTQVDALREVVRISGVPLDSIAAIGITNQRETTLLWDRKTGRPLHNAIVWQCRRTAPIVARLCEEGLEKHIKSVTGLVPDAYFSGSKLSWLLDRLGLHERAERGEICFGTVDSFLAWNLVSGRPHVTDATNASRTMLFDISRKHGVHLEQEPSYGGRAYLEKQDYILMKQKEQLAAQGQKLEELTLKIEDVDNLIDEVSSVAYDKAVELVTDEVKTMTHQEDIDMIEDTKVWLQSPERKAPKKERDYAVARLDGVVRRIRKAMQSTLEKMKAVLLHADKKKSITEEIKKQTKPSIVEALRRGMEEQRKKDSEKQAQEKQKKQNIIHVPQERPCRSVKNTGQKERNRNTEV